MNKSALILLILFQTLLSFGQNSNELIPYRSGTKWGYSTPEKKIIIQPSYDVAFSFTNGLAQVCRNKQCALIDENDKVIIPFANQRFAEIKKHLFVKGLRNDTAIFMGVIDDQGNVILPLEYGYIRPVDGILELQFQKKYGVANYEGKVIIKPVYDYINHYKKDLVVLAKDNLHALFNNKGEQLTEFKYMVIDEFRNNLSKVRLKDLFGFIDRKGKEIIPPVYEMTYPFSNGYAVVKKGGKYGLIDTLGKTVVETKYDLMLDVYLGVASAKVGEKWTLVDVKGKEIFKPAYDNIKRVYNGVIAVKKDNKWAIINPKGQLLSAFEFDEIKMEEAEEDFARSFGLKELKNDEGYVTVGKNKKWGIADIKGVTVIKPEYDNIYPFTNGAALIAKDNKWAVADNKGNIKTGFIYDKLEPFLAGADNLKRFGIILFQRNNLWGIMDTQGKEITPPMYDQIKPNDDNYYLVLKDNKTGIIDNNGKEIIPVKYDRIKAQNIPGSSDRVIFLNERCMVLYNGKQGFVGKNGVEYFEEK